MNNIIKNTFRLVNHEEFIEKSNELSKAADTCVVLLAFNQLEAVKKISLFLKQTRIKESIDVLIVDNHSTDGTFDYLLENYKNEFSFVFLRENYGGAGGFAIGQECILAKGYDYCMLSEEDAFPVDGDIISTMLVHKNKLTRVRAMFYELNNPSFTLHYNLYPCDLFKIAGVMNFDLFFRCDDSEYEYRLTKAISSLGIKTITVDKYYSHCILKEGFGVGINYFSLRNSLLVAKAYKKYKLGLRNTFLHITNAFFALLHDKSYVIFITTIYGFYDYFLKKTPNNARLSAFRGYRLEPKHAFSITTSNFTEFFTKYKEYSLSGAVLINNHKLNKLSKNVGLAKQIITPKYAGMNRVISFLAKDIVFIEQLDFIEEKISYFEYKQKNRLISIFYLLISYCLGVGLTIPLFILFMLF